MGIHLRLYHAVCSMDAPGELTTVLIDGSDGICLISLYFVFIPTYLTSE